MTERDHLTISRPPGGWAPPWPQVAEMASTLGPEDWSLVGGLMVQLHAIHAGITTLRATRDVDMVVHVETATGRPARVATALEELGYAFDPSIDPRNRFAHRFRRGNDRVDLSMETVDVVTADHVAPSRIERLRGYDMVAIAGGTQALRRTINATITIDDVPVTISVPNPYGALILKAAAHQVDSRDKARHLSDAATLLACIADPFTVLDGTASGGDRRRLRHLADHLGDPTTSAWMTLDDSAARRGQAALRILLNTTNTT
ncbi:hypothetical protein [Aeromicrobium sp. CF3.5]|uniref:hypothetical protein n=1 Tax=Aeromicrobium sp. CF3.5 TaxID=3373078 RepID=UPI003EE439BB